MTPRLTSGQRAVCACALAWLVAVALLARAATAQAPSSGSASGTSGNSRGATAIELKHTPLAALEPMLAAICSAQGQFNRPAGVDQPWARWRDASGAESALWLDHDRNAVVVAAEPATVAQVERVVRALDSPPLPAGQTVRVVVLRNARPKSVEDAVRAYRGELPPSNGPRVPPPTAESPPAARNTTQLLKKSPVRFINALFQPAADAPANAAPPPNQPADQPAVDDPNAARRERLRQLGADVDIETLPDLDVVILRGNQRDVDEVIRMIEEIERLSAENEPLIDVYYLEHINDTSLAALIETVRESLVGGRQGRVTVAPLVKPNAVLLIGWGQALEAVRELIRKLDQPVGAGGQLHVFRLRNAVAATAAATIQQFYAQRGGLGPRIVAAPDNRTNSVVVHAAPDDMQEIALLIEQLDRPGSSAVNQARVFRLRNTLAADMAAVVQNAIEANRGGQAGRKSAGLELLTIDAEGQRLLASGMLEDVRVTPDPRTNTLIVTAPADSMDLIAALVEQLDSAPTAVAQIKVFRIVNGDASSLVLMLRSLLPSQAGPAAGPQLAGAEGESSLAPLRFSVDVRTNSIIAAGSQGDLEIIEALLLRLDQRDVEQRKNAVYRLKNAPALDVAAAINDFLRSERQVQEATPGVISPFQQIESEVVVVPEPVSNSLIISATPRYFTDISELVERLDAQPPQVMIQVLIAEVTLDNTDEFGVELGLQDSLLFDRSLIGDLVETTTTTLTPGGTVASTTVVGATNTPGYDFNSTQPLGNSGAPSALTDASNVAGQALSNFLVGRGNADLGFGGLVLSASSDSVSVLLRALQESRRLEVLSRPQVMTLDNQPAFIQVGQRVPRIVSTQINQIGQVNELALENVGLILGVTPRISPEGLVVMEIDAEKSDVGPESEGIPVSISATGEVIRSPRINITTAQTTVSAQDGETVMLGGLITKSNREIHRRVPLLADIPVLGMLFRYDYDQARRTELLIVLTPRVVRDSTDALQIREVEAARMSWTCCEVTELHGPGLCHDLNCPQCQVEAPVVYPVLNPRGELYEPGLEVIPPDDEWLGPSIEAPSELPVPLGGAPGPVVRPAPAPAAASPPAGPRMAARTAPATSRQTHR